MGKIYIGTSGYAYKEWAKPHYVVRSIDSSTQAEGVELDSARTFKEMTPEEAQERLRADLSPEKVSERILDFVRGFVNGSAERAELLRGAVERGYEQAKEAWGGELPEVSEQTMTLVREGLDKLFGKVDVKV